MKLIDRVGERYTRLVVIERVPNKSEKDTNARWLCQCDCGKTCIAYGQDLRKGKFKSCGCLNSERIRKHGMSRSFIYGVWKNMIQRCHNPSCGVFENYGGRGIKVCDEWHKFESFYADMGDRPKGYSLDRIDNDKGYSPDNCRWTTSSVQNSNKRNNNYVMYDGKRWTMTQLAHEFGMPVSALRTRIDRLRWDVEKAVKTPLKVYKSRSHDHGIHDL